MTSLPRTTARFAGLIAGLVLIVHSLPRQASADEAPPPPPPASDAAPPPVSVDPTAAEADRLSDEAKLAYKDKKYAQAAALFEKAFAVQPRPAFLYNLAKCKEKMAEYAEAVKQLERYLETYRQQNAGLESPDRADTLRQIEDLKRRAYEALPEVSIQSVPPGAQVVEDGATLGSTPLVTRMKPGRHKIVLRLPKHSDLDADLDVPLSGKVAVVLSMKSIVKRGGIAVWCNVKGATVVLDGKVAAVTPFSGVLDAEPGRHQVTFARQSYASVDQQVTVPDDRVVKLFVHLERVDKVASFRSYLGWPLVVLGALAAGGGGAAMWAANQEFRGTPAFKEYEGLQFLGYRGGGAAIGLGLAFVAWDAMQTGIPSSELTDGAVFPPGQEIGPLGGLEVAPK